MATGTVDPSAPKDVQGTSAPAGDIDTGSGNLHEKEKQMVSAIRPPHQRHLSPFVITERPEGKQLGVSTRTLTVDDFALLKTLGTGKTHRSIWAEHGQWLTVRLLLTLGTFARVWLVRLKDEIRQRDKVYALKILRKADGETT